MKYREFTDSQLAHYPDYDQRVQIERKGEEAEYNPADHQWSSEPPATDADICRLCYEWRRYPPGQRHFGWAWWRTCKHDCACEHHATELWMA